MSYLGRGVDKISNIETLDNITFNGASSYTLQKGGVNFVPTSAAAILISIDGVVQSGNFSVSSSTIDFGTAVAGTSTCNFIIHLGTGVLTTPSDGSVTNAKLGTAPTLEAKGSGGTAGGVKYFCEAGTHGITLRSPQHSAYSGSYELVLPTAQGSANTFLKNDGSGNLSFAAAGGENTPAFSAYSTDNQGISDSTWTKVELDTEEYDSDGTFSSNRFTPGVSGKYYIYGRFNVDTANNTAGAYDIQIAIYKNGSSYTQQQQRWLGYPQRNPGVQISASLSLNSSDYVELYAYCDDGQNTPVIDGDTKQIWFTGYKIIGA